MGGIRKDEETKRELFFVTLDKSGGDFSPTTSYRDYVMSPELFHWETQGAASRENSAGKRYLGSPGNGWRFFLFVQLNKEEPYTFLGEIMFREARAIVLSESRGSCGNRCQPTSSSGSPC
jgi:hypothetical protein